MIESIRNYLIENKIFDDNCRVNVDFLSEKPTEFSIIKVPVDPFIDRYTCGISLKEFRFQLLSCTDYSADVVQNILNNDFYEKLCNTIEKLNKQKKLPKITGIQSIKCLDNGALVDANTNTARYAILMKITYLSKIGVNDDENN